MTIPPVQAYLRTLRLSSLSDALNNSVKPGLAWAFGLSLIVALFGGIPVPDAYWGISGLIIGYFFQSTSAEKAQEQVASLQDELVALAKLLPPEAARGPERPQDGDP